MSSEVPTATDGVRLLSHRPSVLYKVEHLATEEVGDIAQEGVQITGPGWGDRLKDVLDALSYPERTCLFAVRLDDEHAMPLPAQTIVDRARTDWFPRFLSQGTMAPVFQPLVDLKDGSCVGREALMRGKLGAMEIKGAELMAAAEAHDALFSFDARARVAALEAGLPALPEGEILYVKVDPRAVHDVGACLRMATGVIERIGARPEVVCMELHHVERCPDTALLKELTAAFREHGLLVAIADLSGGGEALARLDDLRPDVGKLDLMLTKGIEDVAARRRLVAAVVECAHESGAKVVALGVERDTELEVMRALDVDYGQGFFLGQPTEQMLPVDARMVNRADSAIS